MDTPARNTPPRPVVRPELRHLGALLQQQAGAWPERPFFTIEGQTYTFHAVHERVRRIAAGLATLGVAENTRVGLIMPNCAAFIFVAYAAAWLGAAAVAINPAFRGHQLDSVLGDSQCTVLAVHEEALAALDSISPAVLARIGTLLVAGAAPAQRPGALTLQALETRAADLPAPPPQGDYRSVQTISFTSGSTGPSKGVLITNNQAFDSACTYIHATGMTADDLLYTPFAFFHGMSTRLGLVPALITGAHVVVATRFSASHFWQEVTESRATIAQTLPTSTALLKALPPGPFDRAHRVTRMYNSRCDPDFETRFGVRLVEAYGMTELGLSIYTPYPERRAGAAGRVHPGWEMAIVDDADRPVPVGEQGELVFRPKEPFLLMAGYVGRPQATVDATRNLWFHSGDIARQDEDGYVYFLDRGKERIRRRGENISSFDVESFVASHPRVAECAAVPHPAQHGEDDIRIVVVAADGAVLDPADLFEWLTGVMPRFMLPRYIEVAERLPRTPTNKIEKFQLIAAGLADGHWDREAAATRA